MTIAEQLLRAKQDYDDVYREAYSVGESDGYYDGHNNGYEEGYNDGYADGVAGSAVTFERDDSTAYIKTVPSNAESKAMLLSVGGMTYRDENTNTLRGSKVTEIINRGASGNEIARRAIPEEITALDGYGDGLATGANIIDFEAKPYIQNCKRITFTGDEDWRKEETRGFYYCSKSMGGNPKGSSERYQINSHFGYGLPNGASSHNDGLHRFYVVEKFPTLAEWVAYVKEQYTNGTPIQTVCVLAKGLAIDISAYLADFDNILEVERGGSLEFVNEYGQAVPSSILYTKKVGT